MAVVLKAYFKKASQGSKWIMPVWIKGIFDIKAWFKKGKKHCNKEQKTWINLKLGSQNQD